MDAQLSNKKTVKLFSPSKEFPLRYPDLLVYCYRVGQSRFDTVPSVRRTAKSTGLREATVATATERLGEHGMVDPFAAVIHPCPHLDWFCRLSSLEEKSPNGPEFMWLQNWTTLVRRPGVDNPLTVPCVLIYSLVRHSIINRWKPSAGWTHEYLAQATATNPKTVFASLRTLEDYGFLSVLDGMRFRLFEMRESQLSCFADKKVWTASSVDPDEIANSFGPGSDKLDKRLAAQKHLVEYVDGWYFNQDTKNKIVAAVMKMDGWETNWQEIVNDVIEPIM